MTDLAEAIAARKAAITGEEFTMALAREQKLREAGEYVERLHPRDRIGKWREKPGSAVSKTARAVKGYVKAGSVFGAGPRDEADEAHKELISARKVAFNLKAQTATIRRTRPNDLARHIEDVRAAEEHLKRATETHAKSAPRVLSPMSSGTTGEHHFDNGYGASVINVGDHYEVAVIDSETGRIVYDTPVTDDVVPGLDAAGVKEVLDEIEALPLRTEDHLPGDQQIAAQRGMSSGAVTLPRPSAKSRAKYNTIRDMPGLPPKTGEKWEKLVPSSTPDLKEIDGRWYPSGRKLGPGYATRAEAEARMTPASSGRVTGRDPVTEKLGPREGLEGPFRYRSGWEGYYSPKEGRYYDPGRDMFLPRDFDPDTGAGMHPPKPEPKGPPSIARAAVYHGRKMLEDAEKEGNEEKARIARRIIARGQRSLREAVERRKAATTGREFTLAYAREQWLRESIHRIHIHFDPSEHPRNRVGEFIDVLDKLKRGSDMTLPGGITIRRKKGYYKVTGHGGSNLGRTRSPVGVATAALTAYDSTANGRVSPGLKPVMRVVDYGRIKGGSNVWTRKSWAPSSA